MAIGLHTSGVAVRMTEFRATALGQAPIPQPGVADHPPSLVGMSAAMDRLRADVMRAAACSAPALITGESGSGKSTVARALHELGPRAQHLCAVVACQAFPETLLEVELFGCAKGSVIGATCDRQGVLEMVDGGTVILENIESISARTQALLERFLETGRVQTIGTLGPGTHVDTRIVATSTARAETPEAEGRNHALWSRLAATTVRVPSLRDRRADVPLLSQYFASGRDYQGHGVVFAAEAMSALSAYSWPGNLTQLRSVVERLVDGAPSGQIRARDLPVGIRPRPQFGRSPKDGRASVGEALFSRVQASGESFWSSVYPLFMKREITRTDLRDLLARALEAARGNADELVRVLNMPRADRQRFARFLRKHGCEPLA